MFLADDKYVFEYITTLVKMLTHEICLYDSLFSIKVLVLIIILYSTRRVFSFTKIIHPVKLHLY